MANNGSPGKRLAGVNRTRPAVIVDCSESAANAGVTPVARGRLVGTSESRPAVVVDCRRTEPVTDLHLKLHLAGSLSDADQVALAADIFALLQALSEAERELGGGGLELADQRTEPGAVILTLRHSVATGAADRSAKLTEMLNDAAGRTKVESAGGVLKLLGTAAQSSAHRVSLAWAGSRTLARCEVLIVAA